MSFCNQCGTQNADDAAFCSGCGSTLNAQPQQPTYAEPAYAEPAYTPPSYTPPTYTPPVYSQPSDSYAPVSLPVAAKVLGIVSMVCGILSCCTFYVGFIFSIAAFITCGIAKSKTPSNMSNSKSTVGLITGIVGIVISIICLIIFVLLVEEATRYSYGYNYYY